MPRTDNPKIHQHGKMIVRLNMGIAVFSVGIVLVLYIWLRFAALPSDQGSKVANLTPTFSFAALSGQELFTFTDDKISFYKILADVTTDLSLISVGEINVPFPSDAYWWREGRKVLWAGQSHDSKNAVQTYTLYENQTPLYWSKSPLTNITASANEELIVWQEGPALFLLAKETQKVVRLAPEIKGYAWSPSRLAIVWSTAAETSYNEIDSTGAVVSSLVFPDEHPLNGIAFRGEKEVVGLLMLDQPMLVQVDLRSLNMVELYTWPVLDVSVSMVAGANLIEWRSVLSADATKMVVQETMPGEKFGLISWYDFASVESKQIATDANFITWFDDKQILFTKKAAGDYVDLYQYSFVTGLTRQVKIDNHTLQLQKL